MFKVWIIVGIILLVLGAVIMLTYLSEEAQPETALELIRIVSVFTAGSWFCAIFWPILIAMIVPGLCLYGVVTAIKLNNHRSFDY